MRRLLLALALTSAGFAQIVVINGSDTISGSRSTINNNFAYLNTSKEALLTFTSPLLRTSNTITCRAATGSVSGCLSAADWTTFNAKGGVSSVGFTGDGTVFNATVPGSPVTSSGLFAPTLHTQSANVVFAGPTTGGAATPSFRAMVAADLPAGVPTSAPTHSFVCNVGSATGTTVITTGDTGCYSNGGSFTGTINRADIIGNAASLATCSITVDLWLASGAYPTSSNKISASAPATLSGAKSNYNFTRTGWSNTVSANPTWGASVASVTGCVYAQIRVEFQ